MAAYRSAIRRRLPAVLKRDGLAFSNHGLHVIVLHLFFDLHVRV